MQVPGDSMETGRTFCFNLNMRRSPVSIGTFAGFMLVVGVLISGCERPVACGNDQVDPGEVCDGLALNGETCVSQGFDSGPLFCRADCMAYNTFTCTSTPVCGNGMVDGSDECDGTNLGGLDCTTIGFDGGSLGCTALCTFDTTGCTGGPTCGDGVAEPPEDCDGADLNGENCATLGQGTGTLTCLATCDGFDTSGCSGGGFMCGPLFNPLGGCGVNDPIACYCQGCDTDGICYDSGTMVGDDCVCPDCDSDFFCSDPSRCTIDGLCEPYLEGCVCSDCFGHPECQS